MVTKGSVTTLRKQARKYLKHISKRDIFKNAVKMSNSKTDVDDKYTQFLLQKQKTI
jgi:hypothetical protein